MSIVDSARAANTPASWNTWEGLTRISVVLILALAIFTRLVQQQSSDVSWLIYTAEWLLDGRKASVDFFETNPPGSTLIYVPAVIVSRLLGFSADLVNELIIFALALAVIHHMAARVAKMHQGPFDYLLFAGGLTVILIILPSNTFGQREHIGLLAMMPWMSIIAMRMPAGRFMHVLAGIGLGCAGVAKPYLLIIPVAMQLAEIYNHRSLHPLFNLATYAATLVLSIYVVAVLIYFPDFISTMLPRVADIYLPVRRSLTEITFTWGPILFLLLVFFVLLLNKSSGILNGAGTLFIIGAVAASSLYWLQGKGSNYHVYPAVALGFISLFLRVFDNAHRFTKPAVNIGVVVLISQIIFLSYGYFNSHDARRNRELAHAINKLDPAPRLLNIGGDIGVGFPVTRLTGGTWVQRQPSLWMSFGAYKLASAADGDAKRLAFLQNYDALERQILVEDILNGQPTIILAEINSEKDWLAWALLDPEIWPLLRNYRVAGSVDTITILQKIPSIR